MARPFLGTLICSTPVAALMIWQNHCFNRRNLQDELLAAYYYGNISEEEFVKKYLKEYCNLEVKGVRPRASARNNRTSQDKLEIPDC
jgi:hypothetical protein